MSLILLTTAIGMEMHHLDPLNMEIRAPHCRKHVQQTAPAFSCGAAPLCCLDQESCHANSMHSFLTSNPCWSATLQVSCCFIPACLPASHSILTSSFLCASGDLPNSVLESESAETETTTHHLRTYSSHMMHSSAPVLGASTPN